jgi:hypothetical protein
MHTLSSIRCKVKAMKKITVLVIFAMMIPAMAAENWNFEFIKDGISVYTREIPGAPLKAFKAEGDIKASMETVNNILSDNPNHVNWMPDCIVSMDLPSESKEYLLSYSETKAPVVSNRDVIVEAKTVKETNKITQIFRAVDRPDLVPEKKGKVRMKEMSGRWEFTPTAEGTHVVFEVKANPGGSIPVWLANMVATDIPYKTLIGLRKMAEGK